MEKVIFAFSGTTENAVAIHWLTKRMNMSVIAFSANLGQEDSLEPVGKIALEVGATQAHVGSKRKVFVEDFVFPALRANADFEVGASLACALSRPLIVQEMVKIAREECCNFIAHGSHLHSNDEIRFESAVAAIAPHMTVLRPNRQITDTFRKSALAYFKGRNIKFREKGTFNLDQNIWGNSIRDMELADTWETPNEKIFTMTKSPEKALARPAQLELGFDAGLPVSINGEKMEPVDIVSKLNILAGKHGIGRRINVQPGIIGNKARTISEAPAATVLFAAHRAIESITLDRSVLKYQKYVAEKYREMIYNGNWFMPLREGFDAFYAHTQKNVSGIVRVRLFRGNCEIVGIKSPFSIFNRKNLADPNECVEK